VEKRDEDDSDSNVKEYGGRDPRVRKWMQEVDTRLEEDAILENLEKDPSDDERLKEQKVIKRELENALGGVEYGSNPTLVLIDRETLDEEYKFARNPARVYEQSMQQQLGRQLGRELKKAFEPKRSRSRPEEDTVSEELDVEPEQRQPTGKYRDVVAVVETPLRMHIETPREPVEVFAEEEILQAMHRLLPITDDELVRKHKEAFDQYLAKKMRDAYETE
jgi:hypothetical protein